MSKEMNPKETNRFTAFELWMKAPNPMMTFFKTLDVTNLVKISRKKNLKFNMLMTYCVGKAAAPIVEFYLLPVDEKLIQYDTIAINTIIQNAEGEVSSCDLLFLEELDAFNQEYLTYTTQAAQRCEDRDLSAESMPKAW